MKKFLIGLAVVVAALPLAACVTDAIPQPAAYANTTVVDEQAAITAELAYKSWRLAATTGVQSGLIKGQTAAHVAALDNKLYATLTAVESAYAAGNAASIQAAVTAFNVSLNSAYAVIGGK
jgi:hypothetical protein